MNGLDFFLLYFQISILFLIITREYLKKNQRNLFAIIFPGGFLILVSGQAWWIFTLFNTSGANEINHLYQTISLHGAQLANFYTSITVIFYGLVYFIRSNSKTTISSNFTVVPIRSAPNNLLYIFLYIWVISMAIGLTNSAGGIVASLSAPGLNMAYGVTMFLILISIGKLPLLHKIATRKKILPRDSILFLITLFFTLLNARLNVTLILLQFIIIYHYRSQEISRRTLLLVPLMLFIIFIIFGLYREFASRSSGQIILEDLIYFSIEYMDIKKSIDWFYGLNIEGFAGLAGLLTYESTIGHIEHDYGLSNLTFITQFIPGSLRTDESLPFMKITESINLAYPYQNGSVIRSGIEVAYANFSVFGLILFGGFLGYFTQTLHLTMGRKKTNHLKIGIISVQLLHMIRGPFSIPLYFGLSDLIILTFYKLVLSITQSITPRYKFRHHGLVK